MSSFIASVSGGEVSGQKGRVPAGEGDAAIGIYACRHASERFAQRLKIACGPDADVVLLRFGGARVYFVEPVLMLAPVHRLVAQPASRAANIASRRSPTGSIYSADLAPEHSRILPVPPSTALAGAE